MFPKEFIKRISGQKYIDSEALLKALEEPSPVSIRINGSKWNKTPKNSEPVTWCTNGYYIASRPSYTLDPLFHSGCYYPQEASGMFLEQVIRQTAIDLKNINVLDLCGAPGGKSALLSDIIGEGSLLVANETIRSRAAILAETVTRWGSSNTLVTGNDPAQFGKLEGYFDIILVDAPCSGEGMFRNIIAVNEWSPENASYCSERQKRIIMDIWPALKENGIFIYSTCTFNPGENEENIKWLIEKNKAECVRLDVSGFTGITGIDFEGIWGYGFYPDRIKGEGFFISAVRKTGAQDKTRIKTQRRTELRPVKDDVSVAERWTHFSGDRVIKWGDEVIGLPCRMDDYNWLYQNLRIVKPGTRLFTRKNNDALPMHELALSQMLKKDVLPQHEVSLRDAVTYLKRGNFVLTDLSRGWILVTYMGINVGFVKNIGNRINNYFPVEWRIRMDVPEPGRYPVISWDGI